METPPPHEKWRSRSGHRLYTKKHSSFFFFSGWCMNGEHSRRQSLAGTGPLMKRGPGQGRPLVIDVPPLSDCSWWRTHSAGRHHRRCLGSGRLAGVSSFKTVPYCTGLPPSPFWVSTDKKGGVRGSGVTPISLCGLDYVDQIETILSNQIIKRQNINILLLVSAKVVTSGNIIILIFWFLYN